MQRISKVFRLTVLGLFLSGTSCLSSLDNPGTAVKNEFACSEADVVPVGLIVEPAFFNAVGDTSLRMDICADPDSGSLHQERVLYKFSNPFQQLNFFVELATGTALMPVEGATRVTVDSDEFNVAGLESLMFDQDHSSFRLNIKFSLEGREFQVKLEPKSETHVKVFGPIASGTEDDIVIIDDDHDAPTEDPPVEGPATAEITNDGRFVPFSDPFGDGCFGGDYVLRNFVIGTATLELVSCRTHSAALEGPIYASVRLTLEDSNARIPESERRTIWEGDTLANVFRYQNRHHGAGQEFELRTNHAVYHWQNDYLYEQICMKKVRYTGQEEQAFACEPGAVPETVVEIE